MTCQEKNYNFLKIVTVKFQIVINLMEGKILIFILFLGNFIGYTFIFETAGTRSKEGNDQDNIL